MKLMAFPGKYVQGPDVIYYLENLLKCLGNKGLLFGSKTAISQYYEAIKKAFTDKNIIDIDRNFSGECTLSEIERIKCLSKSSGADVIIAFVKIVSGIYFLLIMF